MRKITQKTHDYVEITWVANDINELSDSAHTVYVRIQCVYPRLQHKPSFTFGNLSSACASFSLLIKKEDDVITTFFHLLKLCCLGYYCFENLRHL